MPPHEKQTNSRNFRTPSSQVSRVCFDYQTTYYHPPPLPDDFLLHSCYKYKINDVTLRLTPPDSFASCTPLTPLSHSAYFSTSFCSFDWPKTFLISTSTNINTNSATAGNLKHIPGIFLFVLLGLRTGDCGLPALPRQQTQVTFGTCPIVNYTKPSRTNRTKQMRANLHIFSVDSQFPVRLQKTDDSIRKVVMVL